MQVRDDQQRQHDRQEAGHHPVEPLAEHLLAERADAERRDRHAELHRRDEARWVARDPPNRPGALVAGVLELQDSCAPRGDEPVLRRDEERVQQQQTGEGEELEDEVHRGAYAPAAYVLGGRSSSTRSPGRVYPPLRRIEHMFYHRTMRVVYREEPCRSAL